MSMGTDSSVSTGAALSSGRVPIPTTDVGASPSYEGSGAVQANTAGSTPGGGGGFMEALSSIMKDPAVMKELSNLGSKYAGLMAADGKMSPNTRTMLGQIMQGGGKRGPGGDAGLAGETEGINRMALASGMTQFLTPEMASQMLMGVGIPADRARFG